MRRLRLYRQTSHAYARMALRNWAPHSNVRESQRLQHCKVASEHQNE